MKYQLRISMYQDHYGSRNAEVQIKFNGHVIQERYEVTAISFDTANTFVYEFESDPRLCTISLKLHDDEYVDDESDRTVTWCGLNLGDRVINQHDYEDLYHLHGLRWKNIQIGNETRQSSSTDGFDKITLSHEVKTTLAISIPVSDEYKMLPPQHASS